jgi:succinyl-CoA synthetase beta subunit
MSYVGNDTQGNTAYARLVDFEKNNTLYLLMFATGGGVDIETVKPYFDVIVKSFKVE